MGYLFYLKNTGFHVQFQTSGKGLMIMRGCAVSVKRQSIQLNILISSRCRQQRVLIK